MSSSTRNDPPFIGSKITLISKAEIRYEGFLYAIDTERTTVTLSTVRSFGTEDRKAPKFVKPRDEVYEYIIFRGTDIKDLNVSEGPNQTQKPKTNLDDPAIIQSGHGGAPVASQTYSPFPAGRTSYPPVSRYNAFGGLPPYGSYPVGYPQQTFADPTMPPVHPAAQMVAGIPPRIPTPPMQSLSRSLTPSPETVMPIRPPSASGLKNPQSQVTTTQTGTQTTRKKPSSKPSSRRNSADLDTQPGQGSKSSRKESGEKNANKATIIVEKEQKPKEGGNRRTRGRRGGRASWKEGPVKFEEDFDFESSNARFKKEDIEGELHVKLGLNLNLNEDEDKGGIVSVDTKEQIEVMSPTVYYDKEKSFFDSISCEANDRDRNRRARPSWAEERKLNVETFGVSGGMRYGGGRGRGGRGGRGGYRGRGGRGGGRGGRGRGGWSGGRGYRGGRSNRAWDHIDTDSRRSDTSSNSAVNGPTVNSLQATAKA